MFLEVSLCCDFIITRISCLVNSFFEFFEKYFFAVRSLTVRRVRLANFFLLI
nr:MAG TPA: hypothetical protein [Caudoviricetes sp.]